MPLAMKIWAKTTNSPEFQQQLTPDLLAQPLPERETDNLQLQLSLHIKTARKCLTREATSISKSHSKRKRAYVF